MGLSVTFTIGLILDLHILYTTKENKNHYYKNYRPVSNLSFLSKSLERVVQRRLQEFLDSNNLMPETQSAYRQYRSTETAVAKVYNDLLLAADQW